MDNTGDPYKTNEDYAYSNAGYNAEPPNLSNKRVRKLSRLASTEAQQRFTPQQRATLGTYSSVSYAPSDSHHYRNWLRENAPSSKTACTDADRWFLLTLIGVSIGLVATLLNQSIQALNKVRWERTKGYISDGELGRAWGWCAGMAAVFGIIGSFLVCFVHPPAAGGGTPEVISFLNGVVVHGSLSLKNLVVKFVATVFSVSTGLPLAVYGPIINFGAIIGGGIGQFRSKTVGCTPAAFKRFRNAEDRRAFTTAGVAAGVAAAFNAPIGGLLFAMEDLSSFWSKNLSWQTFYCCTLATGVASMFNTAFKGFQFGGVFGLFSLNTIEPIQIHVAIIAPAIVLGLVGGVFGALFTQLNRGFVLARKAMVTSIESPVGKNVFRMFEIIVLVCIFHSYSVILPRGFSCMERSLDRNMTDLPSACYHELFNSTLRLVKYERYECPVGNGSVLQYNPLATLSLSGGQGYLGSLWARGDPDAFPYHVLLTVLGVWLVMTSWTAGSALSGGIFVHVLIMGSLYGRGVGLAGVRIWRVVTGTEFPESSEWEWIDPGVMAVIGAASMLSGVTRLAIASTAIIVEMSNDIDLVIPSVISILIAKFVADAISKPIFKIQLEAKSLPYLDHHPQVVANQALVNLELFRIKQVMTKPIRSFHSTETVSVLARLLVGTDHGAFPVVTYDVETKTELVKGLITRNELYVILCSDDFTHAYRAGSVLTPTIPYTEISVDYIDNPTASLERVKSYMMNPMYEKLFVNLDSYINVSAPKVDQDYSLYRGYTLFRTLGLRHLLVTDVRNRVVGIVTRKDLMDFNMSEKLENCTGIDYCDANGFVKKASIPLHTISENCSWQEPEIGENDGKYVCVTEAEIGKDHGKGFYDTEATESERAIIAPPDMAGNISDNRTSPGYRNSKYEDTAVATSDQSSSTPL